MRTPFLLLATIAITATAGIASAASTRPAAAGAKPTVAVRNSAYGRILFDGRGRALYSFTRDRKGPSKCYGACVTNWPPYIVGKRALAGVGVKQSLIGTTRRSDGKLQVTYAGRPVYFYIGDRKPGQVLCQNVPEFGGTWLVVRPSGKLVR